MYKPCPYPQGVSNAFLGWVGQFKNTDTQQSILHETQEAMGDKRDINQPGVVKRDHLGVAVLQLSFEGIVEKRMKKH